MDDLHDRVGALARGQYRTGGALALTARLLTSDDPDSAVRGEQAARRVQRAVAVLLADTRTAERRLARAEDAARAAWRRTHARQARLGVIRQGVEARLERAESRLRTAAEGWRTARPCATAAPVRPAPRREPAPKLSSMPLPEPFPESGPIRLSPPFPDSGASAAAPGPAPSTTGAPGDVSVDLPPPAVPLAMPARPSVPLPDDVPVREPRPPQIRAGAEAAPGAGPGAPDGPWAAPAAPPSAAGGPRTGSAASADSPAGRAGGSAARPAWVAPVERYTLSAGFADAGAHWAHRHTGQDFAVDPGTTVRSIGPGRVHSVSCGGPFGVEVVVRHPGGWYAQYAHLASPGVRPGQRVTTGQAIARSGDTGNSTGPHLHFEVRLTPYAGSAVHPVRWLAEHGVLLRPVA
ncbi:peptidoglycan DD-metalloendopeptidase family protein [Streptomyces solincola]|nr:peptidoglycan DD-metalloendopeptidase family protein [Streptomyces solincola]